jgi:hypothetical protein
MLAKGRSSCHMDKVDNDKINNRVNREATFRLD